MSRLSASIRDSSGHATDLTVRNFLFDVQADLCKLWGKIMVDEYCDGRIRWTSVSILRWEFRNVQSYSRHDRYSGSKILGCRACRLVVDWKNVLNVILCDVVRRLDDGVISEYHVVLCYARMCNLFLLRSENTAFLDQFSRRTQIFKGIIYKLNFTKIEQYIWKFPIEFNLHLWVKPALIFTELCHPIHFCGHLYHILSRVDEKCRKCR